MSISSNQTERFYLKRNALPEWVQSNEKRPCPDNRIVNANGAVFDNISLGNDLNSNIHEIAKARIDCLVAFIQSRSQRLLEMSEADLGMAVALCMSEAYGHIIQEALIEMPLNVRCVLEQRAHNYFFH